MKGEESGVGGMHEDGEVGVKKQKSGGRRNISFCERGKNNNKRRGNIEVNDDYESEQKGSKISRKGQQQSYLKTNKIKEEEMVEQKKKNRSEQYFRCWQIYNRIDKKDQEK